MNDIEVLKKEINDKLTELRNIVYKNSSNDFPQPELYEFHQNGELIIVGTLKEIQKYTTYATGTLISFSQPAYLKKNEGKLVNKLIKINGEN